MNGGDVTFSDAELSMGTAERWELLLFNVKVDFKKVSRKTVEILLLLFNGSTLKSTSVCLDVLLYALELVKLI